MHFNKQIFTFYILILLCLAWTSCKKDSAKGNLELLQNRWNLNSVNEYANDGSFHHVFYSSTPYIYSFEGAGNLLITPSNDKVYKYKLLADDSTLIISRTDVFGITNHDTNFITTLTNNQLVYHSINPVISSNTIDSLSR